MPFMIAPIACSRMPKCSTRPYGPPGNSLDWRSSGRNDGSPSGVVLLRLGEVGRAAPQLGQHGRDRVDAPAPDALRVAMPLASAGNVGQRGGPAVGQRAACASGRAAPAASGLAAAHASKRSLPLGVRARGPRSTTSRACASTSSSTSKVCVRVEAEDLLGGRDLVGAERAAVRLAGVLRVRAPASAMIGAQRDERRPVGLGRAACRRRRRAPATFSSYVPSSASQSTCCTCQP